MGSWDPGFFFSSPRTKFFTESALWAGSVIESQCPLMYIDVPYQCKLFWGLSLALTWSVPASHWSTPPPHFFLSPHIFLDNFFFEYNPFCTLLSVLVSGILSAQVERVSVSRLRDLFYQMSSILWGKKIQKRENACLSMIYICHLPFCHRVTLCV